MRPRWKRSHSTDLAAAPGRKAVTASLVAVIVATGAAGCGGATQISRQDDTVRLEGGTQQRSIELGDLHLTAEVPAELGSPRADERTGACPASLASFGILPVGSTDHDPRLFFGTTGQPCPETQSLNGYFPTWARVDDLPADAVELKVPVQAPLTAAYRFKLDYMQCTNECYSRTYDVVFMTLDGSEQTIWMQSTDLDEATVDAILTSISVA